MLSSISQKGDENTNNQRQKKVTQTFVIFQLLKYSCDII